MFKDTTGFGDAHSVLGAVKTTMTKPNRHHGKKSQISQWEILKGVGSLVPLEGFKDCEIQILNLPQCQQVPAAILSYRKAFPHSPGRGAEFRSILKDA